MTMYSRFGEGEDLQRTFKLPSGNKIHFKKALPHQMWAVNMDKGQIPERLKGRYTDFNELYNKVQAEYGELAPSIDTE